MSTTTFRLQLTHTRQVRDLQLAVSQPLGTLVAIAANACFSLGLAMFYSWKLTLVIISTLPVMLAVLAVLGRRTQSSTIKQQEKLAEALKNIVNALKAIDTVKCFNGQKIEGSKYTSKISEAASWYHRIANINAQQGAVTQFVGSAMFVQGFYYGGVLVDSGQKSTGDIVTTFISALGAFSTVSGVVAQLLPLEKGRTAGATLRAVVLEVGRGPAINQGGEEPSVALGDIDLRNVSGAKSLDTSIVDLARFRSPILPDQHNTH